MKKIKALFLDRDGVINKDPGYVYRIEDFEFMPGIFVALRGFIELGFDIFVVTNQSGIGRKYYTQADFDKLSDYMINEFKTQGVNIKKIYYCPHAPDDNCECRKPKPGMFLEALSEFNIDMKSSIMIGDKQSDIDAASGAGVGKCFLLDGGKFSSVMDVLEYVKLHK
ncbi:D-glycero-beta-D-manno-heptose 1,7-bisphosphate 7-phosphatase [Campylobacter hyointestinalis]|uniref:D-glycero-beta-D-manno-heptose 1,7-bisphosphate 7-phosphatase n=1 Tax=Campylobacter hyointestinalis TaxID=198 RepID=UPI000DCB4D61|nr:D-glycero-beta-D-manno-heptose 1,7-bisphosphate 7-phosphatase [Campylobacter hyointestinalis]RAZ60781.1 D-glycero-beta-D-manno-heptose-1,7-bisphosphate 7-phosphatase [Campylobacter hyointestinalis subsp. lawsonii]